MTSLIELIEMIVTRAMPTRLTRRAILIIVVCGRLEAFQYHLVQIPVLYIRI